MYGGIPPEATKLELYGTPTCPVLAGHANVKVLVGQLSVAGLMPWPLMLMVTVDPELVSVAEPVTVQLPVVPVKVPDAATVRVLAVAVKVTLPGIVTGEPLPQVTVKL